MFPVNLKVSSREDRDLRDQKLQKSTKKTAI